MITLDIAIRAHEVKVLQIDCAWINGHEKPSALIQSNSFPTKYDEKSR